MDFNKLALEMDEYMRYLWKSNPQKQMNETLRGERFILRFLLESDREKLLPSDISKEMHVSSARTAATLNSLENKGLIHREINLEDRRQILVSLTKEGYAAAKSHDEEHMTVIVKMLSALGSSDAQEFVRILGRIAKYNLKKDN